MLITGARVLDVPQGRFERRDVGVRDGRLVEPDDVAPAAPRIDLDGAYLLPGFFDCHVHICMDTEKPSSIDVWHNALPGQIALWAARAARRMLMCGITTARDVGGWDYHEIAVRNAIRDGWIAGSRLLCAGRILTQTCATTPYYPGMYEEADGPVAVARAARRQLAQGADLIKVMASGAVTSSEYERADAIQYQPEELAAAVRIASENFKRVAAHAHAAAAVINAAEAGCRSVEHSCLGSREAYAAMHRHGTWLVPTVCTTQAMMAEPGFADATPPHIRERYATMHERHIANIRMAREMGVNICMGTDVGTPGNHAGDNMQELEVMVHECGFSPLEAIRSATIDAARMMDLDQELGLLLPGRIADAIAVESDPLADIGALRHVFFVMKDGHVHRNDRAFRPEPDGRVIV
jgi:imidazolonepropionase-like amidohydrolase